MTEKQPQPMNRDDLQKLTEVIAEVLNIGGQAYADKKIDENDLGLLLPLVPTVQKIFDINFGDLVPELKSMTPDDRNFIIDNFKEEFDIPQDELEAVIEDTLSLIQRVLGIIPDAIAIFSRIKGISL